MTVALIPFATTHASAVVALIATVYDEYAMTFDAAFESDLSDIPGAYLARGGCFNVLIDEGRVVGTVAAVPHDASSCEIKRVYLDRAYRGHGHGRMMMERILQWAAADGFRSATAWSDARLTVAHSMYRRLGFASCGERMLDDPDHSRELGFTLGL